MRRQVKELETPSVFQVVFTKHKILDLYKISTMSLQADIQWIKSELDGVRDPDLIEVFKRLLAYRKTTAENEFFLKDVSDLRNRAEASLQSVEQGKTRSLSEFKNEVAQWKAKSIS